MLKKMDEIERLKEVNSYKIEDTLSEKDYDDIAFIASAICGTPIALVTLMYQDRQWFKAAVGTDLKENKRVLSFCLHAIAGEEDVMVVEDAQQDDRFKNNPLVQDGPKLVFYAGAPIVTKNGYSIGTVCVYDTVKKTLTDNQRKGLKILSEQVMGLLELRTQNLQLQMMKAQLENSNKSLETFAMVVAHDIKSSLASVALANEMLDKQVNEWQQGTKELTGIIKRNVEKITRMVEGILNNSKITDKYNKIEAIALTVFLEELKNILPCPKPLTFIYAASMDIVYFNRVQLEQIFNNLFSNAIRYNDKEQVEIKIAASEQEGYYNFDVTDNGMGIEVENQASVFELFSTVAEKDNYGLESSGIGLNIVKKIITAAEGDIKVNSIPGKYTSFLFRLKVQERS
ncbi:GAF domain-containing sensor histidine kinase [Ferruginibacter sp.]|uniref:sensor histidine kinase n=1 Tax=Ferruginibacter sp. TaxID=1940288 RepID=UPI002657F0BD|nr:GAF domain-containing sensor histidine kinase [Ferruginibacter sp.]